MDREKLLQNPLPIDRVAARVTKAAKAENLWAPQPKPTTDFAVAGTSTDQASSGGWAPMPLICAESAATAHTSCAGGGVRLKRLRGPRCRLMMHNVAMRGDQRP
jgi:hypothetical protein